MPGGAEREGGRGAQTERGIYDAAVRLIYERGYHGTSQRAIADAVGLQMSSLYHYFPSKQDLLVDIMTRSMRDLISAVEQAVAQAKSYGPEQRLRAAIQGHILFHTDRRQEAFILDSELRALEPPGRELVVKLRDQYEQIFAGILQQGMAEGVFQIPDRKIAVFMLMAMCTGVAIWYRPGGRLPLETVADIYTDLFLSGALVSGARPLLPGIGQDTSRSSSRERHGPPLT
ncbi:MAG TPA: TetR/AcrR family transcriptional regulator [Actinobacteria bacterium]|nr:TetR/AcrR family transcriptional regulator [Actinomycetota bacterium]